MPSVSDVRIGLLGLGTVGAGVVKILQTQRAMLQERTGAGLTLAAIADTDLTRPREGLDIRALPMVGDAARVLDDPTIHVVVELVGGLEPARTFILRALAAGKHVVTANKALLAHHGAELYEEARRRGVSLGFEAAVAGGIPLIRAVKEGLVANRVLSLAGIVNGTCNYILSKMTDEGLDFSLVLKEAQAHGYAETDPTLDIEGMDSAHKLQILVALAFRSFIDLKHIHTEGITRVTAQDIDYARELGYRIKLLAIAKATERAVEVRVHPTMIPAPSPLAAVAGVFNAIFLTGDAVGDLMFYGRGRRPDADRLGRVVGCAGDRPPGGPRHPLAGAGAARGGLAAAGPHADGRHPLLLLPARDDAGPPRRALARGRHPRRQRHLDRQRHPEGPRHPRGRPRRHAHPRGA